VTTVRYDDGEVLRLSVDDVDDEVVEAFKLDEHAGEAGSASDPD
jgi:hypothetical protein